jgi:hypothetical protein
MSNPLEKRRDLPPEQGPTVKNPQEPNKRRRERRRHNRSNIPLQGKPKRRKRRNPWERGGEESKEEE